MLDVNDTITFMCLTSSVPQPTVTITRSHSDSVLVGTELVLTADISFSDQSRVNVDKSLDILWRRGNDVIVDDSHITISAVSGSGDNYTASLTYSPITISDHGLITAIVTVRPMEVNEYIRTVRATAMKTIIITGIRESIDSLCRDGTDTPILMAPTHPFSFRLNTVPPPENTVPRTLFTSALSE